MPSLPILDRLPRSYTVVESPGGMAALHRDLADAFTAAGYGPDHVGPLQPSDLAGRKPLFELRIGGERFVVRRFSHGGLLRWLTGARFMDPQRPFRELVLADALAREGFATPQVVAARARRSKAGGWRLDVVTRRIEGACNVAQALAKLVAPGVGGRARRRLLEACGRLVRRMHDAGFLHADLTTSNLLLRDGERVGERPELLILDLDRSVLAPEPVTRAERVANLARLLRHVERRRIDGDLPVLTTDYARFLAAYEPDARARAELREAVRAAHAKSLRVHAVGWAAERHLAGR